MSKARFRLSEQRLYEGYAAAAALLFGLVIPLSLFVGRHAGAYRNWQTGLNILFSLALPLTGCFSIHAVKPSLAVSIPRSLLAFLGVSSFSALLACQLCKYLSFLPNGFDFSIFDWMLYNFNHLGVMYSPLYEVNHLGVHQSWIMVPLALLYRPFESAYFLVVATAVILWAAVIPLWYLGKRFLPHEGYVLLLLLAYLTNPWIGAVVDGGFHFEVFYPVVGFCFILGWLEQRTWLTSISVLALLSTKEDAALFLSAFALCTLFAEPKRKWAALAILVSSAALFAFDVLWIKPLFLQGYTAPPNVLSNWSDYGTTVLGIAGGMLTSPLKLISQCLTSNWYVLFGAALFLPLLAWRPLFTMLPGLLMLGSTSYYQMRGYRWYYPIPLLPFFFWGLLESFAVLKRLTMGHWQVHTQHLNGLFAGVLLLFPLVGPGYMSFAAPSLETLKDLAIFRAQLAGHQGPVCTQTILFPHLGHELDLQQISQRCMAKPGAIAAINPALNNYPFGVGELDAMLARANSRGLAQQFGSGFALLSDPNVYRP